MSPLERHLRLRRRRDRVKAKVEKHKRFVIGLMLLNVGLAMTWGPVFICLTLIGPLRHLSSTVVWVAIISYYANMMGNIATAAALYSSLAAHDAHETAVETAVDLAEHEAAG